MSDLEEQLAAIKTEIQDVQRKVARAEYERDTAADAKQQALRNLKEMGADSEEEAYELLGKIRKELAEELQTVQEELAASGD
jgi:hypothetical protein